MPKIQSESIDMILCDLPYGITANKWDNVITLEPLVAQYKRIIKPNGVIALFAQGKFLAELIMANSAMYKYKYAWHKGNAGNFLNARIQPLRVIEDILIFYKSKPTYNPQMGAGKPYVKTRSVKVSANYGDGLKDTRTESNGTRYPLDFVRFKKPNCESRGDRRLHPTEKPVSLLSFLIKTYTNTGDTVLDNAMGSGSTGVAAISNGRKFIGIELNQEYYDMARKRIIEMEL